MSGRGERIAGSRVFGIRIMRLIFGALILLVGVSLLALVTMGASAVMGRPDEQARLARQAVFLDRALADGAAQDMQELFPEGEVFQIVLTALVDAADETRPIQERARVLDERIAALDQPSVAANFGTTESIFLRGWRLLVLVERLRLAPGAEIEARVRAESTGILADVEASSTGVLASYPDGYWPVDTVVAMAAVSRAHSQTRIDGIDAVKKAWIEKLDAVRDPDNGLFVHRTNADGAAMDTARGSSQSIVQVFWPDIDPDGAPEQWRRFHNAFVDRQAGLVGVREYPRGDMRAGDIDSGPLVLGVSASASAVTLGAARRAGAVELARGLDQEAEVLGLGWDHGGGRSYAGGLLPVGDAFLAWSRAQPMAASAADVDGPAPRWWAWGIGVGTVGVLALVVAWRLLRPRGGTRPVGGGGQTEAGGDAVNRCQGAGSPPSPSPQPTG